MKKLIIAEKPNAAKALVNGLGYSKFTFYEPYKKYKPPKAKVGYYESDNEIITYCQGHILRLKTVEEYRGLPQSPRSYDCLPYIPEKFELTVNETDDWYGQQLKVIQKLLDRKDVSEVVHFGDPDKEGELIVREVLGYCSNKHPTKRLWCNSLVPDVIVDAYYNLEDYNLRFDMYLEALARQQTDWILGINVSRWLVKKSHENFPAGRVLVPIVEYVYEKTKAFEEFVPTKSLGINGELKKDSSTILLSNCEPEITFTREEKDKAKTLLNKLNNSKKTVKSVTTQKKTLRPKKLFNLTTFQNEMSKKYGYNLKTSLALAQKLYEKGFISYPRTSVEYLSPKEAREMEKIIEKLNLLKHNLTFSSKNPVFNEEKCIGGHTALVITSKLPQQSDIDAMKDEEKNAYFVIFNRTVSNFAENAKVEDTKVEIEVGEYIFTITGQEIIEKGFLEYESRNIKKKLPEFTENEQVDISFKIVEKETAPPKKATISSLNAFLSNPYIDELKTMDKDNDEFLYKIMKEGASLGTEATTAQIVENAKQYGYIVEKGQVLTITQKGIVFLELLKSLEINLFKERNIEMNKALVAVGQKGLTLQENKENIKNELLYSFNKYNAAPITINAELTNKIAKCPLCGADVIEKANSFQCSNENCKFVIFKNDAFFKTFHRTITSDRARTLINKGQVQLDKLKSKSGKEYSIIIKVNYTKEAFENGQFPKYTTEFPSNKQYKRGHQNKK